MVMTGFDASTGRVRVLYGKTRGLVARRKALQAKVAPICITIEDSESESEQENEKENQQPAFEVVIEKRKYAKNPIKELAMKNISVTDSEDEGIPNLPSLRRGAPKKIEQEDESCDDLASIMGSNLRIASSSKTRHEPHKRPISDKGLLKLCNQKSASNFSAFLDELQSLEKCYHWKIIGEASFSEVFGLVATSKVVKVIPLKGHQDVNVAKSSVPDRSSFNDVHREIQVTQALAKVSPTFVKIHSSRIVKGKYPARLLNARDHLPRTDSSCPTPEDFTAEQEYAALVLADGGEDLESIADMTWTHAASVFVQVVQALSLGEEAHQFEHRDLHWGNIVVTLIEDLHIGEDEMSIGRLSDPRQSGIKATIIDYTLSRAALEDDTLIAYDFADEGLFEGKGDIQYDIYRQMRIETKGDWSSYHPHTNVLWLNYLASKLIDEKGIPNPKRRSRLDQRSNLELLSRNFIMESKQILLSKRFNSASDFNNHLTTIPLR